MLFLFRMSRGVVLLHHPFFNQCRNVVNLVCSGGTGNHNVASNCIFKVLHPSHSLLLQVSVLATPLPLFSNVRNRYEANCCTFLRSCCFYFCFYFYLSKTQMSIRPNLGLLTGINVINDDDWSRCRILLSSQNDGSYPLFFFNMYSLF